MWTLLLLACAQPPAEKTHEDSPITGGVDTGDIGGETPLQDRDSDGYSEDVDCDDTRAAIHPEADEVAWNEIDDNCDGRIDADGRFAGAVPVAATAIYEGRPYNFSLSCPATLDQAGVHFTFALTCTPDPADDWAMLLLGETLTVTGESALTDGAYTGRATLGSSTGWDTDIDLTLRYDSDDIFTLRLSLGVVSLSLNATGTLAYEGPTP